MSNTWQNIAKPILALAPMDGVTDTCFRQIISKYSSPDLVYTEFVSCEGMCRGADVFKALLYHESERPIIAQLYGKTPEFFYEASIVVASLGFDGIDINMGCPSKSVTNGGSGASLITKPELAQQIIRSCQQAVLDYYNGKTLDSLEFIRNKFKKLILTRQALLPDNFRQERRLLPVSVKTRLGYQENIISDWIKTLLEFKPAAIAIHGRTFAQSYHGEVDWQSIALAKKIASATNTLILGNGNVISLEQARDYASRYHLDGILIGRASYGNPFIFSDHQPSTEELASIALEHSRLFEHTYHQDMKGHFFPMRKYLAWYINSLPHARQIRSELVRSNSSDEVEDILIRYNLL